jgi:hypothetical protein
MNPRDSVIRDGERCFVISTTPGASVSERKMSHSFWERDGDLGALDELTRQGSWRPMDPSAWRPASDAWERERANAAGTPAVSSLAPERIHEANDRANRVTWNAWIERLAA